MCVCMFSVGMVVSQHECGQGKLLGVSSLFPAWDPGTEFGPSGWRSSHFCWRGHAIVPLMSFLRQGLTMGDPDLPSAHFIQTRFVRSCLLLRRQTLTLYPWQVQNELCKPGWPPAYMYLHVSASHSSESTINC